ncbi:class I SAM-dependent methyltransferase [Gulosibacter sp. 10]|uniref:class I SAM-dependent methyltransferase n=1 Tax=Gulosibacter sp. 10 TaxID=1255570 RepID=UPI00097F16DA|nr:methyltransferase [Gulosibacter sp. 10]SJM68049.1 23S rRNA (guanine-N-2-)-methyltransferase rlmG \
MTERVRLHEDPVIDVVLAEALATGGIPETVAVIDDPEAGLAPALLALGAEEVRVFADAGLRGPLPEGAVEADPGNGLFDGVRLVLGRLPKALLEIEDLAESAALAADAEVRVILGARERHLVRSMNDALGASFASVRGTRGLRKSRALVATDPAPDLSRRSPAGEPNFPQIARVEDFGLAVAARGGVFGGAGIDIGTRALLGALGAEFPDAALGGSDAGASPAALADDRTFVDLGCGTGLLASAAKRALPNATVIAADRSWWACASAAATARANGLEIEVVRGNAGEGVADESADVVLCNPPFHDGRDVDPGLANELFRGAAGMLRDGGTLYTVFNSHLRHREHLERIVGPTRQLDRTAKFTVTASTRRAR